MKNVEVTRQLQKLKALLQKATGSTPDIELRAHWAQYLCVLGAGLIENGVKEIFSEYVGRTASPEVARYARSRLIRIQNPKASACVETVRAFNPTWGVALEAYLEQDGRKDAIDSIMANRHEIAHGKSSGITISRFSDYLQKTEDVLEFMEKQVRP